MARYRSVPFDTPVPIGPSMFGGTLGPSVCLGLNPGDCATPSTDYVNECVNIAITTTDWKFEGGSEGQRVVLKAAFSLLQQHMDLVEWSLCLAFARSAPANLREIIRKPSLVNLRFANDISFEHWWERFRKGESTDTEGRVVSLCGACNFEPNQLAYACPWQVSFCTSHRHVKMWNDWCCASAEVRLAMSIDAAALVFHELLHVTGVQSGHTEDCPTTSCDRLYMANNTLASALYTRFPVASTSACFTGSFSGSSTVNSRLVPDYLFMHPCPDCISTSKCGGACP